MADSSEGKASWGRINATESCDMFGCRPDVRIIACVSQDADWWNNSQEKGHILDRAPSGKNSPEDSTMT